MIVPNKAISIVSAVLSLVCATALAVQESSQYPQNDAYVTVYEECNFRGKSRALAIGDYNNVRDLNLRNDSISSLRVPRGLQVALFEHERLRGDSTLILGDVACLNRQWNDQASSIQVSAPRRYSDGREYDSGYQAPQRENFERRQNRRTNSSAASAQDLTADKDYVVFANTALILGRGNVWRIETPGVGVETYTETGRDKRVIYLQSRRNQQAVHIDFAANHVRFFTFNGQYNDYPITRTENRLLSAARRAPSGIIKSDCFNYRAYTTEGQGGIRFHQHEGFEQFDRKAHQGRICHNGPLTMELNKRSPNTEVIVEINGEQYRFARNQKEDVLLNGWYRKNIRLQVGR